MWFYIQNYFSELWFLLLEMAPWLLLGLIFAGLLKVYFPQKHIDKYLGKGAPAYFDKFRLDSEEAIAMIINAGGIPVLSHPFTLHCKSPDELENLVKKLIAQGLEGVEVYYSEHDERQTSHYYSLAKRYNLLITGGSDFHGENLRGIDIGTGKGKLKIPYSLCERLKALWEEKQKRQ